MTGHEASTSITCKKLHRIHVAIVSDVCIALYIEAYLCRSNFFGFIYVVSASLTFRIRAIPWLMYLAMQWKVLGRRYFLYVWTVINFGFHLSCILIRIRFSANTSIFITKRRLWCSLWRRKGSFLYASVCIFLVDIPSGLDCATIYCCYRMLFNRLKRS